MMTLALHPPFPPMEALSVDVGPEGQELAVRAEMGWFRLPGISRRQKGRTAIEVRPIPHALFPRTRGSCRRAESQTFRTR
jgi:hypothetical protein